MNFYPKYSINHRQILSTMIEFFLIFCNTRIPTIVDRRTIWTIGGFASKKLADC